MNLKKPFNMTDEEFRQHIEEIFYPKLEYRSLKKDDDIHKNVNSPVCTKCKGKCCKMCGCHFSPDDFEDISFDSLKKEIEKGYISIDYYIDGEQIYSDFGVRILRIRNQGAPIVDMGGGKGSGCILLTENGCKLDYKHRPAGGRLLIPDSSLVFPNTMSCHSKYGIGDCCYEWRPHAKVLNQLVGYFEDKDIPCSL